MIKLSRDNWLALGLFVVLTVVLAIAAIQEVRSQAVEPPLASFSNQPDGTRALLLWLRALDYRTSAEVQQTFTIPDETELLLLLEPNTLVAEDEWEAIDAWIDEGGVLLVSGRSFGAVFAMERFDFSLDLFEAEDEPASVQSAPLISPAVAVPVQAEPRTYFQSERTDFVTHLAVDERPILVSFEQGEGRVILSATPFPFTNAGLQVEANAELVLNLVSFIGSDGLVWFDEWHHGVRPEVVEGLGPMNWMRQTAVGRSLLFIVSLLFVALVLRGWPFGRPVPLPQDLRRRAPVEYITAMANLNRRAGHRTAVLQDYHDRLKRELGQPYRLDPLLPDIEFVTALAAFNPTLDQQVLLSLLNRLSKKTVSEVELVEIAAETAVWLN